MTTNIEACEIKFGVLAFKKNAGLTFMSGWITVGGLLCVVQFQCFKDVIVSCLEVVRTFSLNVNTALVLQVIQPHTATKQAWLRL